jgi:hypothetical protein
LGAVDRFGLVEGCLIVDDAVGGEAAEESAGLAEVREAVSDVGAET